MINGNALDKENWDKLTNYKLQLEGLKYGKLKARQLKHPESEVWEFNKLYEHLRSEIAEFNSGWRRKNSPNMLEELADISNLIDMLFLMVAEKDKTVFLNPPQRFDDDWHNENPYSQSPEEIQ